MLLETAIQELLAAEQNVCEDRSDVFIEELELKGMSPTKTFMLIDILYYLLNKDFNLNYLDRKLYMLLNHLINITESLEYITEVTPTPVVPTATITLDPNTIAFGNVNIGEESVDSFEMSVEEIYSPLVLVSPAKYTISLDANEPFDDKLVLLPDSDTGTISVDTIYVKYVPTAATTDSGTLTITSDEITDSVSLSGTGVTPAP
jgi:hypothetical protein